MKTIGKKMKGQENEDSNLLAPQSSCPPAAPSGVPPHLAIADHQLPIANGKSPDAGLSPDLKPKLMNSEKTASIPAVFEFGLFLSASPCLGGKASAASPSPITNRQSPIANGQSPIFHPPFSSFA